MTLKVSPDGSSWQQAMTFDPASALASFGSAVALPATLSPPTLASDQDDYAPSDLDRAAAINLSATSNVSITGLAGGIDGRLLIIVNSGAQTIVLKSQSPASSAQNRLAAEADIALGPDAATLLRYDGGASRWRCLARPAAQGSAPAEVARRQLLLAMAAARGTSTAQFLGTVFADSFATTAYVDVAGATNLDTGTIGCLKNTSTPGTDEIPTMIGPTTSGVTMSASSVFSPTYEAWKAGDNDGSSYYQSVSSPINPTITIDMGAGNAKAITTYLIQNFASGNYEPTAWTFDGSNDGLAWTTLDMRSSVSWPDGGLVKSYDVASPSLYRHYRLRITAYNSGLLVISELQLQSAATAESLSASSSPIALPSVPAALTPAIRIKHGGPATAGADYNIQVSRDGGATWSSNAVLTDWFTDPSDGTHIVFGEPVDVSGQPSGSDARLKVTTSNNKKLEIHDWGFVAS